MEKVRLGRTGLEVGVAGLGCGGHSKLGLDQGVEHAADIVRRAVDLGITLIDTARAYGTEEAVGRAIKGRRDRVVLSTKSLVARWGGEPNEVFTPAQIVKSLEESLRRLGTDAIDIFHLHAVLPAHYDHCVEVLLPELKRQQEAGKIRHLGITEIFPLDTSHAMLARALEDDHFDVVMVGFSLLNPSARRTVFPLTMRQDVGTLIMFAVRRALSHRDALIALIDELVERGDLAPDAVDRANPLGFLEGRPDMGSVIEAAYRFCRHEPGAHVVLTGTGNAKHLEENVRSILAPPLPVDVAERLRAIFGTIDSVSGN